MHGDRRVGVRLEKKTLLERLNVDPSTFRSAGALLGAVQSRPQLRFFDTHVPGRIAFGPGAGVAVGVSLGSESLRAALVDANGWRHHAEEGAHELEQLRTEPELILDRIAAVVSKVLDAGLQDEALLVNGGLPLLGWGVAWPTPLARDGRPLGEALAHPRWRRGQPLFQRVKLRLGIRDERLQSYSINDTHAAAIAVAHRQTHSTGYRDWRHPHLGIVLRVAGGIGGATIIVEAGDGRDGAPLDSGFTRSILVGGFDNVAGEIGHTPVDPLLVESLNHDLLDGLAPLAPHRCSCTPVSQEAPMHLEAFASARAFAARVNEAGLMHDTLAQLRAARITGIHHKALSDIGVLLGRALVSPVAMLNPATITLTGSLALPPVLEKIEEVLASEHAFGTEPEVVALDGDDNKFVRAEGAALALIRSRVHRRLAELLDHDNFTASRLVEELTVRITTNPLS